MARTDASGSSDLVPIQLLSNSFLLLFERQEFAFVLLLLRVAVAATDADADAKSNINASGGLVRIRQLD